MSNVERMAVLSISTNSLSFLSFLIFLWLTSIAVGTTSAATTPALQATAVPLGNEVIFACRSDTPAVWVKQSPDLAHVEFLSHNGYPIDNSVDLKRFAFSKVGDDQYVLVVKSVQFSDAGFYKCSNVMTAALTVISSPTCAPVLSSSSFVENREVLASCEVEFAGPAPGPRIDWHFGNNTHQGPTGAPKRSSSSVYSNRTFVMTGQEHGSSLFCSVFHDNWNYSIPKPKCVISHFLNVTYKPKLVCPEKLVFREFDTSYTVKCEAYMNPVVHPNDIHWLLGNGNYSHALQNKTKYFNYHLHRVARGYQISAILHKSLLSRKTPTRQLTLHVFGPTRGMPTSTAIDLELHHGPTLNCPDQQHLAAPSVLTVTCNLFAYPSIPWENVTWRVGQRKYDLRHRHSTGFPNIRSIPGGVALALVADRDLSLNDDIDDDDDDDDEVSEMEEEDAADVVGGDRELSSPSSTPSSVSSSSSAVDKEENVYASTKYDRDSNERYFYYSHHSYPETYHVTLQVHATNGTLEKNITVSDRLRGGDDGGDDSARGVDGGILGGGGGGGDGNGGGISGGGGREIKVDLTKKSEDFFGIVEASIVTCFFLMLALVTLLIFGLWHRQSEETGVDGPGTKMTPSCCSWRRVRQFDDDAEVDEDLREYASRVAASRGFGFVGGGVGVEGLTPLDLVSGVGAGVPMGVSMAPNDYGVSGGDSSRCDSHCEESPSCGGLNYSIPRYAHNAAAAQPPASCLDHLDADGVTQHF